MGGSPGSSDFPPDVGVLEWSLATNYMCSDAPCTYRQLYLICLISLLLLQIAIPESVSDLPGLTVMNH